MQRAKENKGTLIHVKEIKKERDRDERNCIVYGASFQPESVNDGDHKPNLAAFFHFHDKEDNDHVFRIIVPLSNHNPPTEKLGQEEAEDEEDDKPYLYGSPYMTSAEANCPLSFLGRIHCSPAAVLDAVQLYAKQKDANMRWMDFVKAFVSEKKSVVESSVLPDPVSSVQALLSSQQSIASFQTSKLTGLLVQLS